MILLLVFLFITTCYSKLVGGLYLMWDTSTNCTTYDQDDTFDFYPDGECVNYYGSESSRRVETPDKGETIVSTLWYNKNCDEGGSKGYTDTYKNGVCVGHPGYYYWSEMFKYGELKKKPEEYYVYAYGNDSKCSSEHPLLPISVKRSDCTFSHPDVTKTQKMFCDEEQRLKITLYSSGWCEKEISTTYFDENSCTQIRFGGYPQYVVMTCKELY